MNWRLFGALLLLIPVAGCWSAATDMRLPADHPANPDASATPVGPRSMTLAVGAEDATPPSRDGGSGPSADTATPAHVHGGHAGNVSPQAASPEAAPATAPSTGAIYVCPMHPEVVSADPNARCPKCNMKINKPKPVGSAPAAVTPPALPGHAAHESQEGGR